MYFAAGSYRSPAAELEDSMTVYIAGGAVVRCYVGPHEWYTVNPETGQKNYSPFYMLNLKGKHIKVCGRGILDQNDIPIHSRRAIRIGGDDITLEGIIIRNSSEWGVYIDRAANASLDNIKIMNYRLGAGGIYTDQASNTRIKDSYIKAFNHSVLTSDTSEGIQSGDNIIINH